jgi:hypothetical protein
MNTLTLLLKVSLIPSGWLFCTCTINSLLKAPAVSDVRNGRTISGYSARYFRIYGNPALSMSVFAGESKHLQKLLNENAVKIRLYSGSRHQRRFCIKQMGYG